ncbi:MAG: hypothetical protein Q8R36_02055 [bacterium]|nr:hypothetical protein [bacterium]
MKIRVYVTAFLFGVFVLFLNSLDLFAKENIYSDPYKNAEEILGDDFIAPEEVAVLRGLSYTKEQLKFFSKTMPTTNTLLWLKKHNYALIPGPSSPLGLKEVQSLTPSLFFGVKSSWHDEHPFSRFEKVETKWIAIRKGEVPGSLYKNLKEQRGLLQNVERVPHTAEMAWFITTFYVVRDVQLFEKIRVRTSSISWWGDPVYIGLFDAWGIFTYAGNSDFLSNGFGLASALKLP